MQIVDPQLTLQISFIEDCITLYDTVLESLAPVQSPSDDGGEEPPPSSCSDSIDMPFVIQVCLVASFVCTSVRVWRSVRGCEMHAKQCKVPL